MRGLQGIVLVAFIGLIGLGLWNARQWMPRWSGYSAPMGAKSPGIPDKPERKKRTGGKHEPGRAGEQPAPSDFDLAPPLVPKADGEVPERHSAFPARSDLPVGATRLEIRRKYGDPSAAVTETRSGHLFERYYYFNGDRTQLTVATLEDGVLISAESRSR